MVISIPEKPPGSVEGHELAEGLTTCVDSEHMLKSSATIQKSCGAPSEGSIGLTMSRPFSSWLVLFARAQGRELPEQTFPIDPKARGDLEIPSSLMLVAKEQSRSILVASKGRGTSLN